ncbi:hypothetical protein F8R89_20810 [Streptomyces sp. SS1-1]|uniref:hypothetical protein n=1 Tax=Streptomyces sp. SS1-1 TaxID=2651869 RepID=UPI00124FD650|nr:hypothetical protein [Streptomyces sp. SS1-1]KAB2974212.1 hypothetical protein F8R89_20810 [Streptomyces sp. SS1-1]
MAAMDWLDGRGFNLLTIIIALVALVAGVVGVLYARRALFPVNRAISYRMDTSRLLAGDAQALPGALTVNYNGEDLQDPHVVKLRLRSTGRHAVASEHYDQGRPIKFDLGRPVVLLDSPSTSAIEVIGSQVKYGPELMPPGQSVTVSLITQGKPLLSVEQYFIDTKVINESPEPSSAVQVARWEFLPAVLGTLAAVGAVLSSVLESLFR